MTSSHPWQSGESVWGSYNPFNLKTQPAYQFKNKPGPYDRYISGNLFDKTKYIDNMPYRKRRRSGRYPMRRKRQRTARGSKLRSGQGITQQYNRSSQYVYKRMPRYKKRAYKKKIQLINHVINKSLGTQSVVFNIGGTVQATDSLNQAVSTYLMYGANGNDNNSNVGMEDLHRMFQNIQVANNPFKIRFESAILDLTFTNVSTSETTPAFLKLELDVYEVMFYQETAAENFSSAITLAQAQTTNINPLGTGINILNRGCTLFELPALGSFLSYKILKKTKYFLDYGQVITYQMKDHKNYEVQQMDVSESTGFVMQKMTKGVFVVHKLVPGNGEDARAAIAYGCTRAYHYVQNQQSTTNDQFNP